MSEKTKRPWLRFHLLTAVLTMLAAGILVYPLVRAYYFRPDVDLVEIGWPELAFAGGKYWHDHVLKESQSQSISVVSGVLIFWRGLCIDVALFAGVLFMVAVISEFLIRRREGRKT